MSQRFVDDEAPGRATVVLTYVLGVAVAGFMAVLI